MCGSCAGIVSIASREVRWTRRPPRNKSVKSKLSLAALPQPGRPASPLYAQAKASASPSVGLGSALPPHSPTSLFPVTASRSGPVRPSGPGMTIGRRVRPKLGSMLGALARRWWWASLLPRVKLVWLGASAGAPRRRSGRTGLGGVESMSGPGSGFIRQLEPDRRAVGQRLFYARGGASKSAAEWRSRN